MDIEKEIAKILIDAKRRGREINSILVGDKEMSEMFEGLKKIEDTEDATIFEADFGTENAGKHSIRIFKVNEESFMSAAYVVDKNEPAIKVSDLTKNT